MKTRSAVKASTTQLASTRRSLRYGMGLPLLLLLVGCIRPQNYHSDPPPSLFHIHYSDGDSQGYGKNYFKNSNAYEAYVEFDSRGSMYYDRDGKATQLASAIGLIDAVRHPSPGVSRQVAVYIFVHGWKNNASDDAGNVWGFRRFLSDIAAAQCGVPVIGIYMGWPGASLKGDQFLSFWNREPIADNVGNSKDFHDALKSLLHAAKGDNHNLYESKDASIAVVIGHSFGGIVLEHAATGLIQEQVDANCSADQTGKCQIDPPADLFLLINEAGAAAIARPFLREIQVKSITYTDNGGRAYPLLISMTSTGDVLTKFAYPGGEFLSFNRPKTEKISPPDPFGQTSTLPYNLLTAANMIALQSHSIEPWKSGLECELPIQLSATKYYCMNAIKSEDSGVRPRNQTPYWIMQLPQIFVPDHGAVFQDYLLSLMEAVMFYGGLTQCGPTSHGLANHHALFRQNLGLTPPQPSGAIGRPTLRKAR